MSDISEVHGTGPSWSWEDGGDAGEVNWHYCELNDFTTWGRFELSPKKKPT